VKRLKLTRKAGACFAIAGAVLAGAPASAQTCHISSDYDITVSDTSLRFDRKSSQAQRLALQRGVLTVDDKAVALSSDEQKRIASFESRTRELVPRIKALGQRAVDLMVIAINEEAARSSPASAARPELKARVDARAQELKTRIAKSTTSKEWRPEAINGYLAGVLADVAPLITGDLAQKAVELTMKGDFAGVIGLKDQASALHGALEQRIRAQLDTLQPEIQKLCPAARELDRLESGVAKTLPDGSRLNLIKVES
jgi:hypothetical protein